MQAAPEAGQIVHVRSRPYLVERVVPRPTTTQDTLVHLSCLADDAQGEALSVLWEREVDALVSSANLTEAAHDRNIEAGVLVEDEVFAELVEAQFSGLVTSRDVHLAWGS